MLVWKNWPLKQSLIIWLQIWVALPGYCFIPELFSFRLVLKTCNACCKGNDGIVKADLGGFSLNIVNFEPPT